MRKRVRVARPVSVPMLINRGLQNRDLEIFERELVEAFAGGWASTVHFDGLADMRDCLVLAAAHVDSKPVLSVCRVAGLALLGIQGRYKAAQVFSIEDQELVHLRLFVGVYRDFWLRQPVALYEAACDALDRARALGSFDVRVEVGHGR